MVQDQFPGNSNPIDAVISWVDGGDPAHREKMEPFLSLANIKSHPGTYQKRFSSIGEITYCVLLILRFAPFVRNIFIVTDEQDPKVDHLVAKHFPERAKSIKIIDHKIIFKGYEQFLPAFNSISIETMLWRIPGLADNYIYFNDDTFLIRPTKPSDWFVDGRPVIRGSWTIAPFVRIAYDNIRRIAFKNILGRVGYEPRHSFQVTQWLSAKMVGFSTRYLLAGHTPHPINRSVVEGFFGHNQQLLEANASCRFREYYQFNIAALNYHLEIKTGNRNFANTDVSYLQPADKGKDYVRRKMDSSNENPSIKFMCVQALEDSAEKTQREVFDYLEGVLEI